MGRDDARRPSAVGTSREPARILVVEDDRSLRELLLEELEEEGHRTRVAGSAEEAVALLPGFSPDLVVSDLRLTDADGLELLRHVRGVETPPAFVIITAFGTVARAVQALKAGADDFLTKPLDFDHLHLSITRVLENRAMKLRLERYRGVLEDGHFHGMIGQSGAMRSLYEQIRRVARATGPVLITGESGVGKELVARAVHRESPRRGEALIAVNCAGVPSELLESEFFGHTEGAFTGAAAEREGLFVEAHRGSLLLDEISEMPVELQAKLLRVLEDGRVRPVGGGRERRVDTRILASTNRDIEESVAGREFRADLLYRLETFTLWVPPLRERGEDLELLAGAFLNRFSLAMDKDVPGVSAEAWRRLRSYPFPGNVRELGNAIERAVAFCQRGEIEPVHLPRRVREHSTADMSALDAFDLLRLDGGGAERLPSLGRLKRIYVHHVLERTDGNKSRAAEILGISRRTLYRYLEAEEEPEPGGSGAE